jgi:hypothetical protein
MKTNKNIEQIKSSAKKIVEDKKSVNNYLSGKITLSILNDRGIKLAMPL